MSEIFLHDDFETKGNDMNQFYKCLEKMDEVTSFIQMSSKNVVFYSLLPDLCTEEKLVFEKFVPEQKYVPNRKPRLAALARERLLNRNIPDEILKELTDGTKLMLTIDDEFYFTSSALIPSIGRRISLSGSQLSVPSPYRDAYLADIFGRRPFYGSMMMRRKGSCLKAFSLFSYKYTPIPQMIIKEIIEKFDSSIGDIVCREWNVDNFKSSIVLEFPDKAKEFQEIYGLNDNFIPGIRLTTSDVGQSSLTATETWRINSSETTGYVYHEVHRGEVDIENVISQVTNNIFNKYSVLPERMCELLTVDISDPKKVLTNILKEIGLVSAIGKKEAATVKNLLISEIVAGQPYTAYDIALMVMSLPERCSGLLPYAMNKLGAAVMRTPFADFSETEKNKSLLLTA